MAPLLMLLLVSIFMESEPEHPPSHADHSQRSFAKQQEVDLLEALWSPWADWSYQWSVGDGESGFFISVRGFLS